MGKTSFSGPAYGAQGTLYSGQLSAFSSGAISTVIGRIVVPVGQDWFATDFDVARQSTGSTGLGLAVYDDGTVISSIVLNSSLADASSVAEITPDGGEYAGTRIAAGSTVTFRAVQGSSSPASSGLYFNLCGYVRYVASTRNAPL